MYFKTTCLTDIKILGESVRLVSRNYDNTMSLSTYEVLYMVVQSITNEITITNYICNMK